MELHSNIYVAGHNGLVGSAIVRALQKAGYRHITTRTSHELDLRNKEAVDHFFDTELVDYVFLAAAKVGGILANNEYPADFIRDNLLIQTNVIDAAYRKNVSKLLFLGSTCIYPKFAPQPLREEYLLTGELEPTNEAYAVAKIAGITMCQSYNRQYGTRFISVMPTNLYGPGDNFDLQTSHVLPALIRKFHEAKLNQSPTVEVWGSGTPRREFLHSDDLADACLFLMNNYEGNEIVNIGVGEDISIRELAERVKNVVGYEGEITFNTSVPDGTPRKLVDVSRISGLGWSARISLEEGLRSVYQAFQGLDLVEQ
ncbi:GDP-L-fucose synthase [Paenibacillus sp. EKM102P]|uniref:GDP-L-fucose synthase family protein n=1 Tax=unclassified Paenibacillus TaxID=185978 RepID=UPI00142E523A|nr:MULTISPECIES: GDP-L-fucose synthase [unclassified Paenibacillus]KAF6618354.1 GDP-L-fucose synthase [Paenibacillus sp. EKM101P]KAF6624700.1 GDP-L-fucose synthase [Paenibacillus sp. EKM102P]KAF6635521.1 GDP-L-fucose synthase [Paenibacillus sp. EKM10P]KAF6648770.1 GDP-L-fucose synthase [Paenibacillus sp. EKM11P]